MYTKRYIDQINKTFFGAVQKLIKRKELEKWNKLEQIKQILS
jgi:hypothetical protein